MPPPILHHPDFQAPIRADHRFPMTKYGYLREALIRRRLFAPGGYIAPAAASAALLARAHDPDYVSRVFALRLTPAEIKRIGLPHTAQTVRRARLSAAGAALAAQLALDAGLALNTAGGAHHAGPEGGAGFSTFNDVAAAALAHLAAGRVRRVLVVDCDVHQGDGTARIFETDDRVFTLSLHAERNYPFEKAASDLDAALPDGAGDAAYLAALQPALEAALAAGPFDLAFYNAGVDVHENDRLGRLALSDDGIRARDRLALARLRAAGLPVAVVIGGAYGEDPALLAERHAIVFEEAARLWDG